MYLGFRPFISFSVFATFRSDALPSGFLWSPVARQVLHRVAEAVLDDDAVHRGLGHPQLQPDGSLRLAVLPEVHHPLPLYHIVLLGLLENPSGDRPPGGPSVGGFCGGRQAADCSGGSESEEEGCAAR